MRILTSAILTAASAIILSSVFGSACSPADTNRGEDNQDENGGSAGASTSGQHAGTSGKGGSGGGGNSGTKATGGKQSGGNGGEAGNDEAGGGASDETGGTTGKGGKANTGGSKATGGSTGTGGGKPGTGGKQQGVGGTTNPKGDGGTGGAQPGTGGGVGKGGSPDGAGGSSGGGGKVDSKSDLPPGPNDGVAEPTGAGTKIEVLPWAGFKAAVTFSLDDGNSSQIQNYSTLNGMGVKLTFYLITQNASDPVWKTALNDGHEIGNHTQTHACGTTAAGESDIKSKFGVTAYTMAAPNGDSACASQAQQNNIFINRGVSDAVISFTADDSSLAYNLNTNIPPSNASASSLTGPIDKAYSAGGWQTFCIHGFTGDANAYQAFPLASLTDAVKTEKQKKDLWIDTMVAVGSYWRGARAFAKATPTTSGSDKTWTWTLPKGFPPGKYLRVKTDGGVVKQKAGTIPWDSHGYYEIALDEGSVTLSAQ